MAFLAPALPSLVPGVGTAAAGASAAGLAAAGATGAGLASLAKKGAVSALGGLGASALSKPKVVSGPSAAQQEQAAKARLLAIRSRRSNTRATGNSGLSNPAPLRKQLLGQ